MAQEGYSGRPLSAKLGLKPGMSVWRYQMPPGIAELLDQQEPDQELLKESEPGLEFAHVFVTEQTVLLEQLTSLRKQLAPDGMIWLSWPKKSSKVPTTVTEDTIREICLPMGLVDVKVCAVDAIWSGLKLVIRKELRPEQALRLAEQS